MLSVSIGNFSVGRLDAVRRACTARRETELTVGIYIDAILINN